MKAKWVHNEMREIQKFFSSRRESVNAAEVQNATSLKETLEVHRRFYSIY